jgi:hypothetical protein
MGLEDPFSTKIAAHTIVIPEMARSLNRRIVVQAGLGKKGDHISKIIRIKKAGDVVQVVEYLHSKCETLSSYHSKAKKITKCMNLLI